MTVFSVPHSCRPKALLLHGHISPHPVIKKPQTLCVCRRKQVAVLALSLVLSGSPVVIKETRVGSSTSLMFRTSQTRSALTQKKSALSIKAWHKPTPVLAEQRSPVAVCANELVVLPSNPLPPPPPSRSAPSPLPSLPLLLLQLFAPLLLSWTASPSALLPPSSSSRP